MVISRLVPISISPLGGSDSGEALQPRAATRLGRRGSDLDHYLDPSLEPRKSAERGEWRPLPPWSPGLTSLPCLGTPLPVFRAPHGGRGGGGRGLLGPEGWRCQFCYRPRGDPLPVPPGFLHKGTHQGAALTGQNGLQAPASGQAGWREDVRARVCVCLRVSLSVCDRGREALGASACAGASVCRSVRGALSPALLARSLPNRPTKRA